MIINVCYMIVKLLINISSHNNEGMCIKITYQLVIFKNIKLNFILSESFLLSEQPFEYKMSFSFSCLGS